MAPPLYPLDKELRAVPVISAQEFQKVTPFRPHDLRGFCAPRLCAANSWKAQFKDPDTLKDGL